MLTRRKSRSRSPVSDGSGDTSPILASRPKSPSREKSPARSSARLRPAARGKSPITEKPPAKPPVKSPARAKSPARTKSPARVKSPAPKSPAKPRARSKSPAPRKSPNARSPSPSRRRIKKADIPLLNLDDDEAPISQLKEAVVTLKRTVIKDADQPTGSTDITDSAPVLRRSMRHLSNAASAEEKAVKEVEDLISTSRSKEEKRQSPWTIWFSVIVVMFLPPAIILYANLASNGNFREWVNLSVPSKWQAYFDRDAALIFLGFVAAQFLIAILPIGRGIDGPLLKNGRFRYRCNGVLSALLTIAALGALRYYNFRLNIHEKYVQLAVTGLIFGTVAAIILYICARRAPVDSLNAQGISPVRLANFCAGRQTNPRFGSFDVKFVYHRTTILATIALNVCIILEGIKSIPSKEAEWTLLFVTIAQIFVAIDYLWFEESFLYSFEYQTEGTGFMALVGYSMWPFFPAVLSKVVLTKVVVQPWYLLATLAIIHNFAYVIYRSSTSEKVEFRKNPVAPEFAVYETIPTSQGKKLLLGGWWVFVRHPNYLSMFVMHVCWSVAAGLQNPFSCVFPVITALMFALRASRVESLCADRYGAAWERYTSRVKHRVVPYIF